MPFHETYIFVKDSLVSSPTTCHLPVSTVYITSTSCLPKIGSEVKSQSVLPSVVPLPLPPFNKMIKQISSPLKLVCQSLLS